MFTTFFNTYKYYALALFAALWSFGIWHVSATYTSASYEHKETLEAQATLKVVNANDRLADALSAKVAADSVTRAAQAAADKTELLNALKDSHYTSCTNTDSVRNIYKRKLQAQ